MTHEEAFGSPVEYGDVVGYVSRLPVDYVIKMVSVSLILLDQSTSLDDTQRRLAAHLFPACLPLLHSIGNLAGDRVLVHRTQLLAMLRIGIMHGCETCSLPDKERRETLAHSLLGINSCIYDISPGSDGFRSAGMGTLHRAIQTGRWSGLDEDAKTCFMRFVHSYHARTSSRLNNALARYADLLINIPRDPAFRPTGPSPTLLADRLQDRMGLQPEEYAALVFGILAPYITPDVFKEGTFFAIDKTKHFSLSRLSKEAVGGFFREIGLEPAVYRNTASHQDLRTAILDFHDFLTHPLVRSGEAQQYWPVGMSPLIELLSSALFWKAAGAEWDEALRVYWGELFEHYCSLVFRRIQDGSWQPMEYVDLVHSRSTSTSQGLLCDGILVQPPLALVLEFKAKAPQLHSTVERGSYSAFLQDVDELLFGGSKRNKAAAQLDATITALQSSRLRPPGFNLGSVRLFAPVVVTLQEWPVGPVVYEQIRGAVRDAGLLQQQGTLPLEIWSCQNLEDLHAFLCRRGTSVPLADILAGKIRPPYHNLPMAYYLWDRFGGRHLESPQMQSARDQMLEVVKATLDLRA